MKELRNLITDINEQESRYRGKYPINGFEKRYSWLWPTYDEEFSTLLEQMGFQTFEELLHEKSKNEKRRLKVCDLFGGGYFMIGNQDVHQITGVQRNASEIANRQTDEEIAHNLRDQVWVKKGGNAYFNSLWRNIRKENNDGFDLIICRPAGPFMRPLPDADAYNHSDETYESLYGRLFINALSTLASGGVLFTQIPSLYNGFDLIKAAEKDFFPELRSKGYEILISKNNFVDSRDAMKTDFHLVIIKP